MSLNESGNTGSKTKRNKLFKVALSGLLVAMYVVIGIICKIFLTFGIYYRITFENLPVILAGILLGPIYGTVVGILGDVVSCVASTNPAVNPIITVGAASVGAVSGLIARFVIKRHSLLQYTVCALAAHLVGQVLIKSVGKIIYYGMPIYGIFIGLGISLVCAAVEITLISIIMRLKPIRDLELKT